MSVNFRVNEKVTLEPIFSFGLNQNRGDLRWGLRCKYNLSPQSSRDRYLAWGIGAAQSRNMGKQNRSWASMLLWESQAQEHISPVLSIWVRK